MGSLAAIILAHDDPPKVRRLIASLDGADIFLHVDRKAPDGLVRQMLTGAGPRVHLVPRRRTSLASWSLVDAELAALTLALDHSKAEHLAVLSGSCYPLLPMAELQDELSRWRGRSRIQLNPLPYQFWDTPRNRDGGLWRFRRRFATLGHRTLFVAGVPIRTVRRPIPDGLRLHASSQWKIYARHHAAALLRVLRDRPEQLAFWRTTLIPDESCAASILQTPELVGPIVDEVRDDGPWYIKWPTGRPTGHPLWLGESDYSGLREARTAPQRDPDEQIAAADRGKYRKVFARKLSSLASPLLDRIDLELRSA